MSVQPAQPVTPEFKPPSKPVVVPRPRMDPLFVLFRFLCVLIVALGVLMTLFFVGWGVIAALASEQYLIAAFSPGPAPTTVPGDPVQGTNVVPRTIVRAGQVIGA